MFRNSKRFLSLFLALLFLLGCTSFAIDASSDLSGFIGSATGFPDDTATIPVGINTRNTFASMTGTVTYDATRLQPTNVSANLAGTFTTDFTTTPGTITITYSSTDPSVGVQGFGKMFTVDFKILASDVERTTPINADLTLTDLDNSTYDMTISSGSVLIQEPDDGLYKITVLSDINYGYAASDKYEAAVGETVQLSASPKAGYRFKGWSGSGVTFSDSADPDATFAMPDKDVEITASFIRITASTRFNIKFNTATGGTANARVFAESTTLSQSSATMDSLVTLTATPDSGYYLKSWSVTNSDGKANVSIADPTYAMATFYMPDEDVFVTPTFEKVPDGQYAVTVYNEGHGAAYAKQYTYAPGDLVTLSAEPEEDYEFTSWSCELSSVSLEDKASSDTTFIMPAEPVVVTAKFTEGEEKYAVSFQSVNGGDATTQSGKTSFYPGSTVTIVAVADTGYRFYEWSASTASGVKFTNKTSYITTFMMPNKPVVITATFLPINDGSNSGGTNGSTPSTGYYYITFDSQGGTTISPIPVTAGAQISAPTPPTKPNYTFGGWYTDAACTKAYDFSTPVTAAITLYARWVTGGLFKDVPTNAWYATAVNALASKNIIKGVGNDKFSPDATITRAQFAQILANLSGVDPLAYATNKFQDVPSTSWYYGPVSWAATFGIVNGTGANTFSPDAPVTRQDIAVMLIRYVTTIEGRTLPPTVAEVAFADQAQISNYAKEAVAAMQRANIISGKANNRFDPKASATRAEASKMIYALLQVLGK